MQSPFARNILKGYGENKGLILHMILSFLDPANIACTSQKKIGYKMNA